MITLRRVLTGLSFLAPLCFSQITSAEIVLQTALGISFPESSSYDQDLFLNASIGYEVGNWSYQLGYIDLGEFELNNSNLDAKITSHGAYIEVIKSFKTDVVDYNFGLGLGNINSEATLEGNKVGSSSDSVPFIEFYLSKHIDSSFTLRGGVSYFSDVSGSDITTVGIGLRYSFE